MKILQVDEKWSLEYDPDQNDRPVRWLRYGDGHSIYQESNAVTAMFYALLEIKTANPAGEDTSTTLPTPADASAMM